MKHRKWFDATSLTNIPWPYDLSIPFMFLSLAV